MDIVPPRWFHYRPAKQASRATKWPNSPPVVSPPANLRCRSGTGAALWRVALMPRRDRRCGLGSLIRRSFGRLHKCTGDCENTPLRDEELVQTRLLIERSNRTKVRLVHNGAA